MEANRFFNCWRGGKPPGKEDKCFTEGVWVREDKSGPESVYKAFAAYYDAYDSALFHQLEPLETTDCSFLVMGLPIRKDSKSTTKSFLTMKRNG